MARFNLFLKGNVDIHDTLHSCRIGGAMLWNGINEVLRDNYPGTLMRIRHETWTRSDALLEAAGVAPPELLERDLPLGMYSATSQFSTALFETMSDAIILSVQPDIMTGLVRHRNAGFLFYPYACETWPDADRQWLKTQFVRTEALDAAASMRNFAAIIERIRNHTEAPILIFNLSAMVPGETIHCFQGLGEIFATRVRRFNLGLIELSEATGVSIIDVDTIIARAGAQAHKIDSTHLTPAGYRLVAEEVVNVLADLGVFAEPSCAAA